MKKQIEESKKVEQNTKRRKKLDQNLEEGRVLMLKKSEAIIQIKKKANKTKQEINRIKDIFEKREKEKKRQKFRQAQKIRDMAFQLKVKKENEEFQNRKMNRRRYLEQVQREIQEKEELKREIESLEN